MAQLPEAAAEEVELVKAIYGDEAVEVRENVILVDLQPRVGQGTALVSATMALRIPDGYPGQAVPEVSVWRSRGLSDSGLGSLLSAAKASLESNGLAEEGCLCPLLEDVSEALDSANDDSECLICLQVCGSVTDASVVHAPCDHIFHATCLGRWAQLKISEAREVATDKTQSIRSQRDALSRELAEVTSSVADLVEEVSRLEDLVAKLSARREAIRKAQEEDMQDVEPEEEGEEDEPPLEEQLASAKIELKTVLAKKRRADLKHADLSDQYSNIEQELRESTDVESAGLPCPVCRAAIPPHQLPSQHPAGPTSGSGDETRSSVSALPADLLRQVRDVQQKHGAILAKRRQKEKEAEEAAAQLAAQQEMPAEPEVHCAAGSSGGWWSNSAGWEQADWSQSSTRGKGKSQGYSSGGCGGLAQEGKPRSRWSRHPR
ncbi:Rnf25 [Symbiodinium natans]|uniref:Rnf25 protein n=1 Tax=Symbiodinium natans TaxID=878477 RepID=A0A812U3R6_9DINO|nr:Rnf25 [Symbiodinium natans]